jgi:hypothetical protein
LHKCKVIHSSLESSDPIYCTFSLVNPITDILLQRSVPVRLPDRGRGSGLEARLRVPLRGVIITTLTVTRVATPIPCVPLGLLRVSLRCSCGLLCYLHGSSLVSARWFCKAVARLSHRSNCSVRLLQEYSRRPGLGNRIALRPYIIDKE